MIDLRTAAIGLVCFIILVLLTAGCERQFPTTALTPEQMKEKIQECHANGLDYTYAENYVVGVVKIWCIPDQQRCGSKKR